MTTLENIITQAIEELQQGHSIEQVLEHYPQHKNELAPLLATIQQIKSLPKKPIPTPIMQRKFLTMPMKTRAWFTWTSMVRWSTVSMGVMLLISAVAGTAYGTMKSLPGQVLFPLKKTAEQMQLKFTNDPVAKATIQVGLTEKRLAEAQTIFDQPNQTPRLEIAALNELSSQTQEAVSTVRTATVTEGDAPANHPIVKSLADITNKQQTLLNQAKSQSDITVATNNALAVNKEAKKFIAIATTNDTPTLIDPVTGQSEITLAGTVSSTSTSTITVQKTTFTITKDTEIKDLDGKSIANASITANTLIRITGLKGANSITAKQIVVIGGGTGEVKGAATTTPESTKPSSTSTPTSSPTSTKKPDPLFSLDNREPISPEATTTSDPNKAIGSFIPEDPQPQFVP